MSDSVVQVEGLSKRYLLHHQGQKEGLRHAMEAALRAPWNWMRRRRETRKNECEEFWALKDVSFDVKQGDVLGVVGRNGAGKSTLLKILSRITEPTAGMVRIKGRVASLLEVGTGFHQELTGRENIFLNGSILGMKRDEIRRKFDEIVAFAEVEQFLDTPVKRYSSGMYVRLAFAVAAHLEPEILVVDEVLAVGDIEFQKKCLGKMKEVSRNDGRTVLFVSHNMAAVKSLTTRAIFLQHGQLVFQGTPDDVINRYLDSAETDNRAAAVVGRGEHTQILRVELLDELGNPSSYYAPGEPMSLRVVFSTDGCKGLSVELFLVDPNLNKIALASLHQFHGKTLPVEPGTYSYSLRLASLPLASGSYGIDVATSEVNKRWDHYVERAAAFEVPFSNPTGQGWDFKFNYGFGAFAWLLSEDQWNEPVKLEEESATAMLSRP